MRELHRKFLDILSNAQTERKNKRQWIDGELEWMTFERTVMTNAVNAERTARGKESICKKLIVMADNSASGHWDYSSKFAFYCAELVEIQP